GANGQVYVDWNKSVSKDAAGYYIERSNDGKSFVQIALTDSSYYTDTGLNTYRNSWFYRIRPFDSCGNMGDYSEIHQTIGLSVSPGNQRNILDWNAYQGWTPLYYVLLRDG